MKLSKKALGFAIFSALLFPLSASADTASLKEAAQNGIYLGSDYCDRDGGASDVARCYYLGFDKADHQYKVIVAKLYNQDGNLNPNGGGNLISPNIGINNANEWAESQKLTAEQAKLFGLGSGFSNLEEDETTGTITVKKDAVVAGNQTVNGTSHLVGDTTMDGNASVGKDLSIKGNATVDKALTVKGNAITEGNQTVNGTSHLIGDTTMDGNASVGKDLSVKGNATTEGNQTVNGTSHLIGDTTMDGNASVGKDLSVKGNATVDKALTVKGNATIEGNQTVKGTSHLIGDTTMDGNASVGKDLSVKGNVTVDKDLTVSGSSHLKDTHVEGDLVVTGTAEAKSGEVAKGEKHLVSGGKVYDYLHQQDVAFGTNSSASNGSVAIGGESTDQDHQVPTLASGKHSVALGSGAQALGDHSVSIGDGSSASGENSVALGEGTTTTESGVVAVGHRRVTQVADAVKDFDAVNLGQMKEEISKGTSIKNMSEENKAALKDTVKETVKVEEGTHTVVTPVMDKDGNVTYKVSVSTDGEIAAGNQGIVTGDTVHSYVKENTANKDLSNISDDAKDKIKEIAGSSLTVKTDSHLTSEKKTDENGNTTVSIGVKTDGKAEKGNQGLVNGDTLYEAIKDIPTDASFQQKADKDLGNISDAGKQVIHDIAKDSVKVIDGDNTTVTKGTAADGSVTYSVHALANGKIEKGNENAVSGDTVKKAMDAKVNLDASNLSGYEDLWAEKLGIGKVESGNHNLVTGDTVYHNVNQMIDDKALVKSDGKVVSIAAKDSAVKINVAGASGNRVITGVATDPADLSSAANVGYVNQSADGLYHHMDMMKSQLQTEIYDSAAKAGAIASLHPGEYDPEDKWNFAAGFGHYHSSNAAALGAFYSPNENTTVNIGTSMGGGDPLITAGVSLKLGKGSGMVKSRAAMAKDLKEKTAKIKDLEEEMGFVQDQLHMIRKALSSLRLNPLLKKSFEDVSDDHWAKEAVDVLHGNGTIDGYPDGKFHGNRRLTRYEYAQIIYNMLLKGQKVDSSYLKEFDPELKQIHEKNRKK